MQKLEPKSYYLSLNDTVQKVSKKLEKCLKEPSEENVHDVRIAIRRLESAWTVLPKKIRQKSKVRKFVQSYKKVFKANNRIRDFDIILQRLEPLSANEEIKKIIYKKKKRQLHVAKNQAKNASNVSFPKIPQSKISTPKLEKRFKKISTNLMEDIQTLIPIVVSREDKIADLHQLRKDCKKLRYILELATDSESSNFVTKLKQIQDLLGFIHDSDITIDFLRKISIENAKELVKKELENRTKMYKEFVEKQNEYLINQK